MTRPRRPWSFLVNFFRRSPVDAQAPTLFIPASEEPFEFDTAGTSNDDDPPPRTVGELLKIADAYTNGEFVAGWWSNARRWLIHSGRLGSTILPKCTVVHTTDMAPGTFAALLKVWKAQAGAGAGAHFLIGKAPGKSTDVTPTGGIVQFAPITRNANHAGGSKTVNGKRVASHGWFKTRQGKLLHPNLVAIGIEIDNAGRLAKQGGVWVHKDSGKIFADTDVFVDKRGRGWERLTDYQWLALETLLNALDVVLTEFEPGVTVVPNGSYAANGVPEASLPWVREVGHWTLDPNRKNDPGPQVTEWLRGRHASR